MKTLFFTFLLSLGLVLQGCASTGASNQEGVAPDSFTSATPSEQYMYRSPPAPVARALAR